MHIDWPNVLAVVLPGIVAWLDLRKIVQQHGRRIARLELVKQDKSPLPIVELSRASNDNNP